MKQPTSKIPAKPNYKKPLPESKKGEIPSDSAKIFVNLIADIVFENLLNKYRK